MEGFTRCYTEDGNGVEELKASLGKTIYKIKLNNNVVSLTLDDGSQFEFWDNGQNCCEERYLDTFDDIERIEGQKLVGVQVLNAGTPPEHDKQEVECHEISFLEFKTDKDVISFSSHNLHNGYYGGISLTVKKVK